MSHQELSNDRTPSLAPKIQSIEASWAIQKSASAINEKLSDSKAAEAVRSARINLNARVIVRSDAISDALQLNTLPVEIYAILSTSVKKVGGALLASVEDLASVALREIPYCIAPIYPNSMPNIDSLMSADAIELQLGEWGFKANRSKSNSNLESLKITWPLDAPDLLRFAKKIELIRCLAQSDVPVGVAVPICETSVDSLLKFQWLSEIGIDYVNFRSASACLGVHHPAQAYFRCDPIELAQHAKNLLNRPGKRPVAIAVDYPWNDGFHAAQAILAGASFVCVDGHLAKSIPSIAQMYNASSSDSLSSGVFSRSSVHSISEEKLSLMHILHKLDLNSALSLFTDQLRSSLEYSQ